LFQFDTTAGGLAMAAQEPGELCEIEADMGGELQHFVINQGPASFKNRKNGIG
jgi:hypothetical protein